VNSKDFADFVNVIFSFLLVMRIIILNQKMFVKKKTNI